jgi:hypothetical protein
MSIKFGKWINKVHQCELRILRHDLYYAFILCASQKEVWSWLQYDDLCCPMSIANVPRVRSAFIFLEPLDHPGDEGSVIPPSAIFTQGHGVTSQRPSINYTLPVLAVVWVPQLWQYSNCWQHHLTTDVSSLNRNYSACPFAMTKVQRQLQRQMGNVRLRFSPYPANVEYRVSS